MKDSEYTLAALLSDDSFFRWINNEASGKEKKKWQQWMEEKEEREKIVEKARKVANMPFREVEQSIDVFTELRDLKSKLRNG